MIKIYINHIVFRELAKSILKTLINLNYNAVCVNIINENDNELYILFGAHELTCYPPKNYIIYNLMIIDNLMVLIKTYHLFHNIYLMFSKTCVN